MRSAGVIAAIALVACSDPNGRLFVEISSSLTIPRETNSLTVRVMPAGGTLAEKSYSLGDPPRDVWPQVLPILADSGSRQLTITAEAVLLRSGMPSVIVGYGSKDATLPQIGEDMIQLDVAPQCEDKDGDGYGVGFGCANPDCDDARADVPDPVFCPMIHPQTDGGVQGDGGPPSDGGPGFICDITGTQCPNGQVCFSGGCFYPCDNDSNCDLVNEACLESVHVCICRVPCGDEIPCIFGGECIDGCCTI